MRTVRCSGRLSCHAHPSAMHTPPPPHRGQNDRRLWKHNLSATTADGNKNLTYQLNNNEFHYLIFLTQEYNL